MSTLLKASLMALGAACVLLCAGGFPLSGTPEVYHSGVTLLLGMAVGVLCLWGAWRLAEGARLRLLFGMVSVFLTCAGVVAVWEFGALGVSYAAGGGSVIGWFAVAGMGCLALVGLLSAAIFGFIALRLMSRALWLAALHVSAAMLLLGAYIDLAHEQRFPVRLPVGAVFSADEAKLPHADGLKLELLSFETIRHTSGDSYTLYAHQEGRWQPLGTPQREGEELVLGEERWPAAALRRAPGVPQDFLLLPGAPPRLLVHNEPPVKEYRAQCRITYPYRGATATREETLRVNAPLSCDGWLIYLMNYRPMGEKTLVELSLRRAPGRFPAHVGMLGLIICAVGWCFSPAKPTPSSRS